jgi:uncharacterized protein
VSIRLAGLGFGVGFGFLMSWAGLSDAAAIRNMLLLREAHVFLFMGSAVLVAAIGLRLLRAAGTRAVLTGDPIAWSPDRIERRHVVGSLLFGAGWSIAGTCPGPVAAMVGQGRFGGCSWREACSPACRCKGRSREGARRARGSNRSPSRRQAPQVFS